MPDRTPLLESALDSLPQGMALLDREGVVVFWNQAAEAITGYAPADLQGRALPEPLQPLLDPPSRIDPQDRAQNGSRRGALVHARHKLGHDIAAIAQPLILRDALGNAIGAVALFHPAERLDALPHGDSEGNDPDLESSQADLEERLQSEFEDWQRGGQVLGVLWIAVDQAPDLRRTHGAAACQAMMGKMQRALAAGLRPAEEFGRWGDGEFLVIAHERTADMLLAHAHTLAGLARTADFRWWGDRISLTVSIGAAQGEPGKSLQQLLNRARQAMESSARQSGNRVTLAQRHMQEEIEPASDSGRQA